MSIDFTQAHTLARAIIQSMDREGVELYAIGKLTEYYLERCTEGRLVVAAISRLRQKKRNNK